MEALTLSTQRAPFSHGFISLVQNSIFFSQYLPEKHHKSSHFNNSTDAIVDSLSRHIFNLEILFLGTWGVNYVYHIALYF